MRGTGRAPRSCCRQKGKNSRSSNHEEILKITRFAAGRVGPAPGEAGVLQIFQSPSLGSCTGPKSSPRHWAMFSSATHLVATPPPRPIPTHGSAWQPAVWYGPKTMHTISYQTHKYMKIWFYGLGETTGEHSMSICTQRALKVCYPYITCHR